jgi:uncharacterized damage-inducible protein DinB
LSAESPDGLADERTMLVGWLDLYRDVMVMKVEDLDEERARFKPTSTANSLHTLIVHLTGVELGWFEGAIAGRPIQRNRDAEFEETDITVADAIAAYRAQCARSNDVVASVGSLEDECAGRKGVSVRWVLHHMLEETARHTGHADITRELLDGEVGWNRTDRG